MVKRIQHRLGATWGIAKLARQTSSRIPAMPCQVEMHPVETPYPRVVTEAGGVHEMELRGIDKARFERGAKGLLQQARVVRVLSKIGLELDQPVSGWG